MEEERNYEVAGVVASYEGKGLSIKDRATASLGKTKVKVRNVTEKEKYEKAEQAKEQDGSIV